MERLLTVDDLAELLQFKRQSIYNLVHKGKIPFIKVGTSLRFKVKDIEEYLHTEIKIIEKEN